jgi:predicted RNA-binding Zn-ribbon protein involved in translation (DUF1610 family)
MSILLTCASCRQSLKVKDDLAGKRVKCPRCGERVPAPAAVGGRDEPPPTATAEEPSAAAPLLVRCTGCGLKLKAKPEKAGKSIKCPKCARVVKVPMPEAETDDDWIDITEAYQPPSPRTAIASRTAAEPAAPTRAQGDWGRDVLEEQEIPEEMQEKFRAALTRNEYFVWCARPLMPILMRRARLRQLYGILLMIGITIAMPLIAFALFRLGQPGALAAAGLALVFMVIFELVGFFMILTPAKTRKNAPYRPCYALTNRRLLIHPGKGTQTYLSEDGNRSSTVVNADQVLGIIDYPAVELMGLQRIENKRISGAGDLVLWRTLFDKPAGQLTALGDIAAVEKRVREQLLHPIIDKLLRGELALKDTIGLKKRSDAGGEVLRPEHDLSDAVDDEEEDVKPRRAPQKAIQEVPAELRAQAERELTKGEELLWVGVPQGKTQRRSLLGVWLGKAQRCEPRYFLYALTNRRALLWVQTGLPLGKNLVLGGQRRGPVSYYPLALGNAEFEEDTRVAQGGSILFKKVRVTIVTHEKNRTTTKRELHLFGILRVQQGRALARMLFNTLVRPVRRN